MKPQTQKKEKEPEAISEPIVKTELKAITAEEQAIAARVSAENQDWRTLTEGDMEDYSLMKDPFELPPPAKEKQEKKEFFFRWITRNQQRLDEMRSKQPPFRYWICNSTNTPFLKGYFDPILGCVSREDQMLVFKPWWMHIRERQYKDEMAHTQDAAGDITKKDGQQDGDYEWQAGVRSIESSRRIGTEIKGQDLVVEDIGDYTESGTPVSTADLEITE